MHKVLNCVPGECLSYMIRKQEEKQIENYMGHKDIHSKDPPDLLILLSHFLEDGITALGGEGVTTIALDL